MDKFHPHNHDTYLNESMIMLKHKYRMRIENVLLKCKKYNNVLEEIL